MTCAVYAIAMVCFISCSTKKSQEDAVLRVAIAAAPLNLDPRVATDAEGDKISHLICDGLLGRGDEMEIWPLLAGKMEKISDLSYRFHLRPHVKFHDGTLLTADDVVFTYRSIIDGKIISPHRASFGWMQDIVAESPEIVRIDLKEPFAPFLTKLTIGIVSKANALKNGDAFGQHPVCTGPYRFVRAEPNSVVVLSANAEYFGGAPKTSYLEFHVVKDDNVRALKLIKGDVDLIQNGISPMLLEGISTNKDIKIEESPSTVMAYMGFNLIDSLLSRREIRQAIALAIDRDSIIANRWRGHAKRANSILSPASWAYDRDLEFIEYDPSRAMKLLDEAGFADPDGSGPKTRFQIILKTSTSKDRVDIARTIAKQLEKIGIGVIVRPYEWGTFYRDIRRGNFQSYTLSWVGVADPDIFYDVCHSSRVPPQGLNRGRYINREVDRLVEEGRSILDDNARREVYLKVQKILLYDLPFIPLWYENNVVVYRKELKGVRLRPDASYRVLMDVEKKLK